VADTGNYYYGVAYYHFLCVVVTSNDEDVARSTTHLERYDGHRTLWTFLSVINLRRHGRAACWSDAAKWFFFTGRV